MKLFYFIFFSIFTAAVNGQERRFPDGFKLGVATASYQVEGAWNVNGKGESIWDEVTHNNPWRIDDYSNGDDACDSYYHYKRDVEMVKSLGVDFYRFSLSWPRILPTGFSNQINEDGIRYYNNLIDELISNGIEPIITLYHWDLPQPLQVLGGWANPYTADYFVDFARVVFDNFADRVSTWVTFNEPYSVCAQGYGLFRKAPFLGMDGIADYMCSKTLLMAHARTYRMFKEEYDPKYPGQMGLSEASVWGEPASDSQEDLDAVERYRSFLLPWFIDPVFKGDFPEKMREFVAIKSKQQGYSKSRLPEFTEDEKEILKGSADFLGANLYTTYLITSSNENDVPSLVDDMETYSFKDPNWKVSSVSPWLSENPEGYRAILNWFKDRYDNIQIMLFENGYATIPGDTRDDDDRVDYYRAYWDALLDAILVDGCNVTAYTAWSLMDNFEWTYGYTSRFGLFEVDFDSPDKTRRERKSAKIYKELVRSRVIDYSYNPSAYEEEQQ